jgi:Domain of unknown function (DUF4352)
MVVIKNRNEAMNPQEQFNPQQPQAPTQPVAPGPVVIGPTQAQQPAPIQPQPMAAAPLFAPDTHAPSMPVSGATGQPFGSQPFQPQPPMGAKSNKKMFIIAGAVVLVLIVGGVVALSGGKEKTTTSTTPSSTTPASSVPATDDITKKEEPAATAVTTPINRVLVGDLGLIISATKMTRNFQQKDFASANPDQEAIVLNLTATSNEGYSLVVSATSFRLVTPDGKEYRTASVLRDTELKAAGLTPWPGGSAKKGIPITGDMAFGVPKNSTSLILRYKQDEIKVIGANARTIPAKNIDIPLLP